MAFCRPPGRHTAFCIDCILVRNRTDPMSGLAISGSSTSTRITGKSLENRLTCKLCWQHRTNLYSSPHQIRRYVMSDETMSGKAPHQCGHESPAVEKQRRRTTRLLRDPVGAGSGRHVGACCVSCRTGVQEPHTCSTGPVLVYAGIEGCRYMLVAPASQVPSDSFAARLANKSMKSSGHWFWSFGRGHVQKAKATGYRHPSNNGNHVMSMPD